MSCLETFDSQEPGDKRHGALGSPGSTTPVSPCFDTLQPPGSHSFFCGVLVLKRTKRQIASQSVGSNALVYPTRVSNVDDLRLSPKTNSCTCQPSLVAVSAASATNPLGENELPGEQLTPDGTAHTESTKSIGRPVISVQHHEAFSLLSVLSQRGKGRLTTKNTKPGGKYWVAVYLLTNGTERHGPRMGFRGVRIGWGKGGERSVPCFICLVLTIKMSPFLMTPHLALPVFFFSATP